MKTALLAYPRGPRAALRLLCALALCAAALAAADTMNEIRSGNFAPKARPPADLKLLDWNIERGTRLDEIAGGIESQRPDLAILQEVDLNAPRSHSLDIAKELAQRLKLNFAFGTEFQELSQGSAGAPAYHGNAILTSLRIRSPRIIRFAAQSGFWQPRSFLPQWSFLQRRLGGRMALVAELDYHGRTLVVYNLHLESRSGGDIQFAELKEVLADAARYPADTPIVIAGDLNTKYRHSMLQVVEELTEQGYENAFGDRSERTHVFVGSLDYIFARGPIRLRDGKVHRDMHGSDHFPVSAELVPAAGAMARR